MVGPPFSLSTAVGSTAGVNCFGVNCFAGNGSTKVEARFASLARHNRRRISASSLSKAGAGALSVNAAELGWLLVPLHPARLVLRC